MLASPLSNHSLPAADSPFMNRCYLNTAVAGSEPDMCWGTEVDMSGLQRRIVHLTQQTGVLTTPVVCLIQAVGIALERMPQFNARVLGGRIYRFKQVNAIIPIQRSAGGATLSLLKDINLKSSEEIVHDLQAEQRLVAEGAGSLSLNERIMNLVPRFAARYLIRSLIWTSNNIPKPMSRFDTLLRAAPVVINHFNFPGTPPLLSYKPSRFASTCALLNVTLGPTALRPCVVGKRLEVRPMAGLFVRGDHRLVDARELSQFTKLIVNLLSDSSDSNAVSNGTHCYERPPQFSP